MFKRGQKVVISPVMPGMDDIAGKRATVHHEACDNSFYIEIDTTGERLYINGVELKPVRDDNEELLKYMDH